jgi:hypothetical protein
MVVDVLTELTDTADALTEPHQSREPRWTWDADRSNRNKIKLPDHVVTLPGLITQVGDIVWPSGRQDQGDFHVRPVPSSRPPGDPEASACYLDVSIAVTRWHVMLGLTLRDTLESSIRQLLGRISREDRDTQLALLDEMRQWRRHCEVITGLVSPDPQLQVPCPVDGCGARTLRINVGKRTARCTSCKARWAEQEDPDAGIYSISILAQWIGEWQASAKAAADSARQVARQRKTAGRPAA